MKHITILSLILFTGSISFAQNTGQVTQQTLQKIKADVDKQAVKFRQTINGKDLTGDEVEFSVDTFKIEQIANKRMETDYSTVGMNTAVNELTNAYDKLMNKYYNKLLQLLKSGDRTVLTTAQKAWLAYRNAEAKLILTMLKDEYSGGGTVQSNIRTGLYSDLVVKRTIQLFHYYSNVIKEK